MPVAELPMLIPMLRRALTERREYKKPSFRSFSEVLVVQRLLHDGAPYLELCLQEHGASTDNVVQLWSAYGEDLLTVLEQISVR